VEREPVKGRRARGIHGLVPTVDTRMMGIHASFAASDSVNSENRREGSAGLHTSDVRAPSAELGASTQG